MTELWRTTADVNLAGDVFPDFPPGWRSANGIIAAFLFAGALEVKARRSVDPYDPWGNHVLNRLPKKFQVDGLGSLVGQSYESGEQIGRPVLLGLVWQFVDEVYRATSHLRDHDELAGYQLAIREVEGIVLGTYGTMLFTAAFHRNWFSDAEPRPLSDVEALFLAGETISQDAGHRQTALIPNANSYVSSIWSTAFRLIERRSPEFYLTMCGHQADVVEYIINKRANDQADEIAFSTRYRWTGWPNEAEAQGY